MNMNFVEGSNHGGSGTWWVVWRGNRAVPQRLPEIVKPLMNADGPLKNEAGGKLAFISVHERLTV